MAVVSTWPENGPGMGGLLGVIPCARAGATFSFLVLMDSVPQSEVISWPWT